MTHLSFDPEQLGPREAYRLLTSAIVPRPIGWISTLSPDGIPNLAPYSFFQAVGAYPPTLLFSAGQRQGPKDSLRNAQASGEFVANIVSEELATAMNETSADYPYGVSEFEMAGLTPAPCELVRAPRVLEAPVSMECRVLQITPVQGTNYTVVFGQVLRFHLREGLLNAEGSIEIGQLRPLARLSGDAYAALGRVFELKRPRL